ncbi:MAG: TRAP transporter small permease [Bacillota bacterium]
MKKKLLWFYNNFEQIVCGLLLTFLMSLLFVQVISRYFLGRSFAWATELSNFSFLFLVYMAASLGAQKGIHIRVTAQLQLIPEKVRNSIIFLTDIVWIAFNFFVIYQGFILIGVKMVQRPLISAVMMWDMRYIFLIIPLTFVIQTFRIIEFWIKRFKNINVKEADIHAS